MHSFEYTNPQHGDKLILDPLDHDGDFLVTVAELWEESRSVYLTMSDAKHLRDYLNTYVKD